MTRLEDSFSLLLCRCHTPTSTLLCGSFKASSIFLLRKTKVLWSSGYYICSTKWDLILTQICLLNFIIAGRILSKDVLFCSLYLYISLCLTVIYKAVLNYHLTWHRFLGFTNMGHHTLSQECSATWSCYILTVIGRNTLC